MRESASGEADSANRDGDKEFSCPTCSDTFDTANGRAVHHYQAHGESISKVNVECAWCGDMKKETAGNVARRDRFFCDIDCKAEWQSVERTGEDSPTWDGGKVTVECEWCGDTRRMWPSQAQESEHHFCQNKDCAARWRAEQFSGKDSPRWNGGYDHYYGANWRQQRRRALKRDQYRCQECGATESDIGRSPSVHHRVRINRYKQKYDAPEWYEKANRLDNLISLCPEHHSKWEHMPVQPAPKAGGDA